MTWINKLYDVYQACAGSDGIRPETLWPVAHIVKRAHVEVILNKDGKLRTVRRLDRQEAATLIPTTEASAGRTSGLEPHPLCEELSYCAKDLPDCDPKRYQLFIAQFNEWCASPQQHAKVLAVKRYLEGGSLWRDIGEQGLFPMYTQDAKGAKTKVADEKVFVRWRVEEPGVLASGTWEDASLIDSWQVFDATRSHRIGFCGVTGLEGRVAKSHPRFVRFSSDGGKLISANDFDGLTFRGRFTDGKEDRGKQACTVSFDVSQKAHSALRWLIGRQSFRNDDQVIVSWATNIKPIPEPFANTFDAFGEQVGIDVGAGQAFAIQLRNAIAGYRSNLSPSDEVVVMGIDSATPGRMAITYYRELKGSEFLNRVESWHVQGAWPQNFGIGKKFVGAPSPRDIAVAAYGHRVDEKLMRVTVERLIPCIVDGLPLPRDLMLSVTRRASSPNSFSEWHKHGRWEWEKCLGIACSLFKACKPEEGFSMSLEEVRTSRDYLFGRLLAIADRIENDALYLADEQRETNAMRLMQRFADRPSSTWRTIELSLPPYVTRLRNNWPGVLHRHEKLLDVVMASFQHDDFTSDRRLSPEFLLGYHCQRAALRPPKKSDDQPQTTNQ